MNSRCKVAILIRIFFVMVYVNLIPAEALLHLTGRLIGFFLENAQNFVLS